MHKRLKVLAAERGIPMQDLLEAGLNVVLEGGLEAAAQLSKKRGRGPAVPPHLELLVEAFVEFWQREKTPLEEEVQRLMERTLKLPPGRKQTGRSK